MRVPAQAFCLPAGINNSLNMSQPSKEELKEMCKGGMGSQAVQDMDNSGGGGGTAFGTGFDSSNTGEPVCQSAPSGQLHPGYMCLMAAAGWSTC